MFLRDANPKNLYNKNITNVANFFFIYETGLIVRVSCERDVNGFWCLWVDLLLCYMGLFFFLLNCKFGPRAVA